MRQAEIDRILRSAIDRGDVPGVVAMAGTREGPVYQGAFGKRALPDGAEMTPDTVFWIASMTKAVTSAAALQLVEQGRLALDRPIADVLPELASRQILDGFDAAGEPRLRPARRPITLRHLITHTAGFVYDIWSPEMGRYMEKEGIPGIISCQNAALDLPLTSCALPACSLPRQWLQLDSLGRGQTMAETAAASLIEMPAKVKSRH